MAGNRQGVNMFCLHKMYYSDILVFVSKSDNDAGGGEILIAKFVTFYIGTEDQLFSSS